MANEKVLIYADDARREILREAPQLAYIIDRIKPANAVEVVHGRWEKEVGDLHSSGYAVRCSVCNDVYFVHHKFALGALTAEVLFKKPKYCPNCGAKMDGDGNADV